MYKLAHRWEFVDSDLFNGLTRELIRSIGTQTYGDCGSFQVQLFPCVRTDYIVCVVRKLAEDLCLEDGPLAKKCEEFEGKNRSVLAESR